MPRALTRALTRALPRALTAVLLAAGLAACGQHVTSNGPNSQENGYLVTNSHGGLLKKAEKAPNLHGSLLGGGTLALSSLKGKVVVVNFYASWCSPCRAETPLLVAADHTHAAQGLDVVGVLFEDSTSNGEAFRRTFHVTYPSLTDPDGEDLADFRNIDPSAIPVTIVLNRAGMVAARYEGGLNDSTASNFTNVLDILLAQPA